MKNLLSIFFFLSVFASTANAQISASAYGIPSAYDYRENTSSDLIAEGALLDRVDFAETQNRLGFRTGQYMPRLGNPLPAHSFDNQLGTSGPQQFGFGTGYMLGPVRATLAYRNSSNLSGPLLSRNTLFGGTLAFAKGIKFSGLYLIDKTDLLPDNRDTREWILGASAPFGANTFMATYIRHINKTMNDADASRFSLGYDYSLSEQTHFYTSFSHLFNEGGALRLYAPGDSENLFNAGIRHQF